ncbi:MAG: hypothetical protein ABR518_08695 [Actinomycetota bacterium]
MIPCAYLRVFRPLDSFVDEERSRWERYIVSGGPPKGRRRLIYREESFASDRRLGLLAADEGDHADVRLVDGRYYLCPWRTKLRVLASLLSLRETAPTEMADALVPEGQARRAARELARLKRREPSAVPSMIQSAWHVPIRWFLLVDDDERHLVERIPDRFRLFYWTPIGLARGRVASALRLLRRSDLAHLQPPANELLEWLSAFGADAAVELDYATVSDLFTWDELDNDHSGRDMQEAVRSLREPDGIRRSLELYQALSARWSEARSRESLN